MDEFFNKKRCDRCGASLEGGFTMSRFDTSALCMKCAEEERQHPDYQLAADIELAAVRAGNRNFEGIGWLGKNGQPRFSRSSFTLAIVTLKIILGGEILRLKTAP